MSKLNRSALLSLGLGIMVSFVAGCGGDASISEVPPTSAPPNIPVYVTKATAGVPLPLAAIEPLGEYQRIASNKNYGRRQSPFALLASERKFEMAQRSERLFNDGGGFMTYVEEPVELEDDKPPVIEQQPPRRLVGVLLGDGVSALIQMEDGRVYEIRPGTRLQVGDNVWTVVSIDGDRAVLRREGNKLPKEVTVVLGPGLFRSSGGGGAQGGGSGPSGPARGAAAGGSGNSENSRGAED